MIECSPGTPHLTNTLHGQDVCFGPESSQAMMSVAIFTCRDVLPGDELTLDYNPKVGATAGPSCPFPFPLLAHYICRHPWHHCCRSISSQLAMCPAQKPFSAWPTNAGLLLMLLGAQGGLAKRGVEEDAAWDTVVKCCCGAANCR